jgi:hypothetical protein
MYVWTFEIGEYIILHGIKIGLLTRLKIKHNFLHRLKAKNDICCGRLNAFKIKRKNK